MTHVHSSPLLRRALALDAVASGATGALCFFGAPLLAPITGLSEAFLQTTGIVLAPFVVFLAWLATQAQVRRMLVVLAVAINVTWTADSFVLPLGGWIEPTPIGMGFVAAQALAVGAFAALQWAGLKRSPAAA